MLDAISMKLLEVSIALSVEKDDNALLERILTAAMDITDCDAGTLYIKNGDDLHFNIMITKSMGGRISHDKLPPVKIIPSNVCARALIDRKTINIDDVYENKRFDFSGPKNYDAMTGYKTVSMLVVPMEDNHGEQIGVVQLINAKSSDGDIIPFEKYHETFVSALTSQAAISLVKMNQAEEINGLLDSLVKSLSTAIYERTPYNVTHTRNMVAYSERFLDWLSETEHSKAFSEDKRKQFIMSVWLHDVGKLTVPLRVMNKESRLSSGLERVLTRLELISAYARLEEAKGICPYEPVKKRIDYAREVIIKANTAGYMTEELVNGVSEIAAYTYRDGLGNEHPWLTPMETDELLTKRGTLTANERMVMESHVLMTKRILSQVSFGKKYNKVAKWAGEHHEFLNGTGYPLKLKGDQLCFETRLLTIIDVFDGLSAKDRPYRKQLSLESVMEIMNKMAMDGQLDSDILKLYTESKAWEGIL